MFDLYGLPENLYAYTNKDIITKSEHMKFKIVHSTDTTVADTLDVKYNNTIITCMQLSTMEETDIKYLPFPLKNTLNRLA